MGADAGQKRYGLVVAKVGTSTLTDEHGRIDQLYIDHLMSQVADIRARGTQVVIVTSGAIGAGLEALGFPSGKRPDDIPSLQAAAAVGQIELIRRYEHSASMYGICVGQMLLTRNDTSDRHAYLRARDTITRLLELGALPIINENDSVSVDEIRFGDNDTLAAMVATLVGADIVCLLSDIDGLYTADPRIDEDAELLSKVGEFTDEIIDAAGDAGTALGSGGMATKVRAARVLMAAGIPMVICQGRKPNVLSDAVAGEQVGTLFDSGHATAQANARKLWIALGDKVHGTLVIDDGAANALRSKGSSLLPVGVREVKGEFSSGATVDIRDLSGHLVGRGITAYDSSEARAAAGKRSADLASNEGTAHLANLDVVHRDEMIVL